MGTEMIRDPLIYPPTWVRVNSEHYTLLTLVMGPWPFLVSPDTEEVGDSPLSPLGLDLKGVMDCDTPEASVNCSLSSTLVLPLAENCHTVSHITQTQREQKLQGELQKMSSEFEILHWS